MGPQGLVDRLEQRHQPLQAVGDRARRQVQSVQPPLGQQAVGRTVGGVLVQQHLHPNGDSQDAVGDQPGRRRCHDPVGVAATATGGAVAASADDAAVGADLDLDQGGGMGLTAARGVGQAAGGAAALVGGELGDLVGGREVLEGASGVARASALLATGAPGGGGGGRWTVGGVCQSVGPVAALATAAIQALLEEPNLGLQVVEALLLLLQSCVGVSLELGELFLELGLAPFGSLEHRLVEAGLGAGFGESAVTVGRSEEHTSEL